MTREEAIEIITLMHEMAKNSVSTNTSNAEALDMAIRALKNEQTDGDLVKENTDLVKEDAENADKKGILEETVSQSLVKDGDLISRTDLLKELEKWDWQELYLPIHFKELVDELPSAENTAEWIKQKSGDELFPEEIVCSKCYHSNSHLDFDEHNNPIGKVFLESKYCPNCGCRMKGVK